jgi:hypothetical protein
VISRAEGVVRDAEIEAEIGPLTRCECGTAGLLPDGWGPLGPFPPGTVLGMKCAGCGQPKIPHIARDVPDA